GQIYGFLFRFQVSACPPTKPKAPHNPRKFAHAYMTRCGIAPGKMLSLIYLGLPAASNSHLTKLGF
ncbi:MAG: hypothetical protein ABWZ38_00795, partial [Candidatus Binatia bacterium]